MRRLQSPLARHTPWRCCAYLTLGLGIIALSPITVGQEPAYTGSASCRECHDRFHELWSTSHHGLALQPYTDALGAALTPQKADVEVDGVTYRAHVGVGEGFVREVTQAGERDFPILHALGGKNVFYFLTELDKGRLQTLPVAYDVPTRKWYDMAGSGVRHFVGQTDSPYHWTDPPYTFNTSCHACHVSQLSTNYDLDTDTYATTWKEPGINCETCHGPAEEHIRVCREAPEGKPPADLKMKLITQKKGYSAHQVSATCSGCHAKMSPITKAYALGDDFYDHYDLTTLEHIDFYPDGRDLGENYTYTTWRMSPCVKGGKLDCMHCHTSSGRYRFAEPEKANDACLPCHQARVENAEAHTRHKGSKDSPHCVSCHMPTTRFAAMMRSDHSMRPPMPAASQAFKSPLACTKCHKGKDAAWADKHVREWHKNDYQAEPVRIAKLIDGARKERWDSLLDMLEYIQDAGGDEIVANSLVRLLRGCPDDRKWAALSRATTDHPSPLVRGSAAEVLSDGLRPEFIAPLVRATGDTSRLVRVRAAAALSPVPPEMLKPEDREQVDAATAEFKAAMTARPDAWTSHYNLGNFYTSRRDFAQAVKCFEQATRLRPDALAPYVNASLAYNALGRNDKAEASLRRAIEVEPEAASPHVNLGMLLGELGRIDEAEQAFRTAMEKDAQSAVAAFNLGVIVSERDLDEAIALCRQAYEVRPDNARYGYTAAFYLHQAGDVRGAVEVLEGLVASHPGHADAYGLLGSIYLGIGETDQAMAVYRAAAESDALSVEVKKSFQTRYETLQQQSR